MKIKIMGRITPGQEEKLNKLLRDSDSEHEYFLHLLELEKQLEIIQIKDEPVEITNDVMQKISLRKTDPSPSPFLTSFFGGIFSPVFLRYAFILLFGIMIGSVFTWMLIAEKNNTNTQMLSGTLTANPNQGFSFSNQSTFLDVVSYQIGNLHYVNIIINTGVDLQMEVSFKNSDFTLRKSGYVSYRGKESDRFENNSVFFAASGKTSFQIILEKLRDNLSCVTISAIQDQSVLMNKQLFLK